MKKPENLCPRTQAGRWGCPGEQGLADSRSLGQGSGVNVGPVPYFPLVSGAPRTVPDSWVGSGKRPLSRRQRGGDPCMRAGPSLAPPSVLLKTQAAWCSAGLLGGGFGSMFSRGPDAPEMLHSRSPGPASPESLSSDTPQLFTQL